MTYADIMLNIKLKFNFNMMIRVKKIKVRFTTSLKPIVVEINGFEIVLITRNEFEEWTEKKLKLLHMLEEISARIKTFLAQQDKQPKHPFEEDKSEEMNTGSSRANTEDNSKIHEDMAASKKGFVLRLLFKFVYSLDLRLKDSKIKFLVIKDEGINVSAANIKDFFYNRIDSEDFLINYECFTLNVTDYVIIDISPNTEYEMIVSIQADSVTMTNTSFPNCPSIVEDLSIVIKIPPEVELMKHLCNWQISVECERGIMNMSMDYLMRALKFFMWLDTLLNVIKRVRTLLVKLHHLKEVVDEEKEREQLLRSGFNPVQLDNYKNLDIPKGFSVKARKNFTFSVTYPKHPLTSIMKIKSQFEKISLSAMNVSFEMMFNTNKQSYVLNLVSPVGLVEVNQQE